MTEPKPIGQPAVLALDRLIPSQPNRPTKDGDLSGITTSIAEVGLPCPLNCIDQFRAMVFV